MKSLSQSSSSSTFTMLFSSGLLLLLTILPGSMATIKSNRILRLGCPCFIGDIGTEFGKCINGTTCEGGRCRTENSSVAADKKECQYEPITTINRAPDLAEGRPCSRTHQCAEGLLCLGTNNDGVCRHSTNKSPSGGFCLDAFDCKFEHLCKNVTSTTASCECVADPSMTSLTAEQSEPDYCLKLTEEELENATRLNKTTTTQRSFAVSLHVHLTSDISFWKEFIVAHLSLLVLDYVIIELNRNLDAW